MIRITFSFNRSKYSFGGIFHLHRKKKKKLYRNKSLLYHWSAHLNFNKALYARYVKLYTVGMCVFFSSLVNSVASLWQQCCIDNFLRLTTRTNDQQIVWFSWSDCIWKAHFNDLSSLYWWYALFLGKKKNILIS